MNPQTKDKNGKEFESVKKWFVFLGINPNSNLLS